MTNQHTEGEKWEENFYKQFFHLNCEHAKEDDYECGCDTKSDIAQFISSLLSSQRMAVIEEAQKVLRDYEEKYPKAKFNEAVWCLAGLKNVERNEE